MIDLRDPKEFNSYVLEFFKTMTPMRQSSTGEMNLDVYHANSVKAKDEQQDLAMHSDEVVNPTYLLYELFSKKFLFSFVDMLSPMFDKYIGFSKQSLSISLIDEDGHVRAIAIRRSKDRDGNIIKWKTYGSKSFIPHKINDEFIFLAVGMAEFVLFEMMKVSYILLQSDSVYRHISQDIISKASGKHLVILKENDESFSKLIVELQRIFINSNILIIDFEKMLNRQLPKGYDFRDYVNETGDINVVEKQLEQEIIKQIKDKK